MREKQDAGTANKDKKNTEGSSGRVGRDSSPSKATRKRQGAGLWHDGKTGEERERLVGGQSRTQRRQKSWWRWKWGKANAERAVGSVWLGVGEGAPSAEGWLIGTDV